MKKELLSDDQKSHIRATYRGRGGPTLKRLANDFGVSVYTIWKTLNPERAAKNQRAFHEKNPNYARSRRSR